MNQQRFKALELIYLAALSGKEKIYGIPDAFAAIPPSQRKKASSEAEEQLLARQILTMDFDGKVCVSEGCRELIEFCCDCRKCLTINLQKADGTACSFIFWKKDKKLLVAEVIGEQYLLSFTSAETVRKILDELRWDVSGEMPPKAEVPQTVLAKAKRLWASGKDDEMFRLLRQNGANEQMASIILDGLQEKAQYVGFLLMDNKKDICEKTEVAFLGSRGVVLALNQSIVNFRSCLVFKPVNAEAADKSLLSLAESFLQKERRGVFG